MDFKYKFYQTNREVFESTLKEAVRSDNVPELTQDIDKYAEFIVTSISTAVDKAIPTFKSEHSESQPVSENHLRQLRRNADLGSSTLRHTTLW